jgi:hypothetical protein
MKPKFYARNVGTAMSACGLTKKVRAEKVVTSGQALARPSEQVHRDGETHLRSALVTVN